MGAFGSWALLLDHHACLSLPKSHHHCHRSEPFAMAKPAVNVTLPNIVYVDESTDLTHSGMHTFSCNTSMHTHRYAHMHAHTHTHTCTHTHTHTHTQQNHESSKSSIKRGKFLVRGTFTWKFMMEVVSEKRISHQRDLSSVWSFISVVSHQCDLSLVIFHQCDLSSAWFLISVIFHQCGLSSV